MGQRIALWHHECAALVLRVEFGVQSVQSAQPARDHRAVLRIGFSRHHSTSQCEEFTPPRAGPDSIGRGDVERRRRAEGSAGDDGL